MDHCNIYFFLTCLQELLYTYLYSVQRHQVIMELNNEAFHSVHGGKSTGVFANNINDASALSEPWP